MSNIFSISGTASVGTMCIGNGSLVVNGRRINVPPHTSLSVRNGRVYADGKALAGGDKDLEIADKIELHLMVPDSIAGRVRLETGCGRVFVTGSPGSVSSTSGDISVKGDVKSSVSTTSGDLTIEGSVMGNAQSVSGDLTAREIHGSCSSVSGDIRTR